MIPCQDTPIVKAPYDIAITIEAPLVAACSALPAAENHITSHKCAKSGREFRTYTYTQPIPIPSYLIAMVAGDLKREQIGPRSAVWCEKEIMAAAKYELEPTEQFLVAGEKICGIPYIWKTYVRIACSVMGVVVVL